MDLSEKILDKKEELLDEFENLKLEELALKIKQVSNRENNFIFSIACLAARVSVLNQRIQAIINENTANDNYVKEEKNDTGNIVEKIIKRSKKPTNVPVEWVRVQIKETTEVNGVRFPSGIQIDVTSEDAQKMIEGDKAILLEDLEKDKEKETQNLLSIVSINCLYFVFSKTRFIDYFISCTTFSRHLYGFR